MSYVTINRLRTQVCRLAAECSALTRQLDAVTQRYEEMLAASSHCCLCGAPTRTGVCRAHSDLIEGDNLARSRQTSNATGPTRALLDGAQRGSAQKEVQSR